MGSGPPGVAAAWSQARWLSLISTASIQAKPVVVPAAAAHGVLFQGPPAGGRLARVIDRGPRAGDRGDEPGRQGRDPAEALKEVEGDSLHRQQRAHRPARYARPGCPARGDRRRPGAAPSARGARTRPPGARRQAGRRARRPTAPPGARSRERRGGIVAAEVMSPTSPRSSARACASKLSKFRRSRSPNPWSRSPMSRSSTRPGSSAAAHRVRTAESSSHFEGAGSGSGDLFGSANLALRAEGLIDISVTLIRNSTTDGIVLP